MLEALAAVVVAEDGKSTILGALREAASDEPNRPETAAKSQILSITLGLAISAFGQ